MANIQIEQCLQYLRCPATLEPLHVENGELVSEKSSIRYPYRNGIIYLVTEHEYTPVLLDEHYRYWRFMERLRDGAYPSSLFYSSLDEMKRMVKWHRERYEDIVALIDFSKRPKILDLAAGQCETCIDMAARGAEVVAMDFCAINFLHPVVISLFDVDNYDCEQYTVANGARRITEEEITFPRVVGNAERLPFADGYFDAVFGRSAMHHFESLPHVLCEVNRVLKKGGMLYASGDGIRPFWESQNDYVDSLFFFQEGLNDQIKNWGQYEADLKETGFGNICVRPQTVCTGLKLPHILSKLKIKDPLPRLDAKDITGWKKMLLRGAGGVVNWIAEKTQEVPRISLQTNTETRLAHELMEYEQTRETLHERGLQRHADIPATYTARTIPRPFCFGFDKLEENGEAARRRMFREGRFLVRQPDRPAATLELELDEENGASTEITLCRFPDKREDTFVLRPGRNAISLPLSDKQFPCEEFSFEIAGEQPVYFIRLGG